MRMCPVPLRYHSDLEKALEVSFMQSKTTHPGTEAAEACQVMTFLICRAINYAEVYDQQVGEGYAARFLDSLDWETILKVLKTDTLKSLVCSE